MTTYLNHIEALNQKANMNMEVLAQHWNEDFNLIREYFHNVVDKFNLKSNGEFIKALYEETEKEVSDLLQ